MADRQCQGTTKKGKPCKSPPLKDGDCCLAHSGEETRGSVGFGGVQEGGGRPRLPRAVEVMRARVEEEMADILAPYFEALTGATLHTSYQGEVEVSAHPDLGARIDAAEKLLDRVYGKPRQSLEHVGGGGGPLRLSAEVFSDPKTRKALDDLVGRVAAQRDQDS